MLYRKTLDIVTDIDKGLGIGIGKTLIKKTMKGHLKKKKKKLRKPTQYFTWLIFLCDTKPVDSSWPTDHLFSLMKESES